MLSRIAESLYWVGRYVERAEDTARILDVHVHHLLEDPSVEEEVACRALLAVMGMSSVPEPVDTNRVSEVLAFDASHGTSIRGALEAARENARGAQEALSSEMWECLNGTYNGLAAQAERAQRVGPHAFFRFVKDRSAMIAGLAESTLSRDDGWRFLVLGRSLERVDMTCRLLLACFGEECGPSEWVTTLRSCGAHEAYLRTYRRPANAWSVAEFLLLDRLFPRSAFHAIGVAEQCLAVLEPRAGRAGLEGEARRVLGRARTELEFRRVGELIADLPRHLDRLQAACGEAGEAVARRFFHQTKAIEWSLEEAVPHT
jgi:uncharacterized alpha-E superfamily protein